MYNNCSTEIDPVKQRIIIFSRTSSCFFSLFYILYLSALPCFLLNPIDPELATCFFINNSLSYKIITNGVCSMVSNMKGFRIYSKFQANLGVHMCNDETNANIIL